MDVIAEARLNLVIHHLRQEEPNEAYQVLHWNILDPISLVYKKQNESVFVSFV